MTVETQEKDLLRFLTAGSVDDGKSTLIGRLLYESNGIYEDQLSSIRKVSFQRNSTPDLSLITDGLKAEREQGITIDVAYRYFSTPRRKFIVADTPGHEQYTRNMTTGASTAEVAVILIDARKGLLQQTRRHTLIAWLLGIRQVIVAVNKMDLVNFDGEIYRDIVAEFDLFAKGLSGVQTKFVPVSATGGDNIVYKSLHMPWNDGPTLLHLLETVRVGRSADMQSLRFPIQTTIRQPPDFRGYAGQIASGILRTGQKVMSLPSRKVTEIRKISLSAEVLQQASAPLSVTLELADELDTGRGDMFVEPEYAGTTSCKLEAIAIWMTESRMAAGSTYILKHTTQTVSARIVRIHSIVDVNTLADIDAHALQCNDIGRIEIETSRPIFLDSYKDNRATGSFILIDARSGDTVAAGMISDASPNIVSGSVVGVDSGHDKTNKQGLTVWFTGLSGSGKTTICRAVETELLARGLKVEVLDGDVVRRNLSKDLGFSESDRMENIRRIAFVAQLLTRHGIVVLVAAISPYRSGREEARTGIENFMEVFVNAPLAVCEGRDPKGLYRRARAGEIQGFTGIDHPYEVPLSPDVECHTDIENLTESSSRVMGAVLHFLSAPTSNCNGQE